MTRLRLNLLGALEARLEPGPALGFRTRKAQALVAYLALPAGRPHRRDELAALLWGDTGDQQARTSLRQALYDVRRALGSCGATVLRTGGDTVALEAAAVDVDVAAFTRLAGEDQPDALGRAALLYRGDLLEGFHVGEESFETWLVDERERLRDIAIEALGRLLSHQSRSGALAAALRTARQLLAMDRLQEPVHRAIMRFHAQLGQRAAALRQYQVCADVLQRELGIEPEPETRQLFQAILRQRAAGPAGQAAHATTPARASPATRLAETPLVGREASLAALHDALARAESGNGRLLAVVGEAGIGKSRIVEELMAHAAQRGTRVLLGRAHESDQILLLGPWVEAFRTGELEREGAVLDALGPVWRTELSRLLPALGAPGAPPPSDRVDYRRLFEGIAQLVERLAARDTLHLVLEDVHWADELSLRLVAFLARRVGKQRVLLVVTAREEELADVPLLRRILQDLGDGEEPPSIPLARLSRSETALLVGMLAQPRDAAAVERLAEQVWTATEGNPLMVVETMHALRDGGPHGVSLPRRVREVIGRRLERLSERTRSLLTVAAAVGRDCDFELLRRVAGCDEDAATAAVEELVRRRLLTGVGERVDFTHHQIREVVYGELAPWRRRVLHRRIAESIEALHSDRLTDFWEVLAEHFDRGEVWTKAAGYWLSAGERARRRYAYSIAERSAHRAADAAAREPDEAGVRTRALELLGDVASLEGDIQAANRSYRSALGLASGEAGRRRLVNKLHRPRFARRDGARIAFYEHGGGSETLLFMNPIVYGLEIFQPVLEHLCQEFRVITMDARGTGRSDPIRGGYGTRDHAADVRAVIEAAGAEPVTAIGISKSSSILIRLAVEAPGLVRRLVLIGSLLEFWPNGGSPPVSDVDARFRQALRSGDLETALPLFVATVVTDAETGELAEQFTRNLMRLPRDTVLSTWAPDPDIDVSPLLPRVRAPTLVMHGTEDRRVPVSTAHYLVEHLPDARLHLFQRTGHLPIFTATAEFCHVLGQFVRGDARREAPDHAGARRFASPGVHPEGA